MVGFIMKKNMLCCLFFFLGCLLYGDAVFGSEKKNKNIRNNVINNGKKFNSRSNKLRLNKERVEHRRNRRDQRKNMQKNSLALHQEAVHVANVEHNAAEILQSHDEVKGEGSSHDNGMSRNNDLVVHDSGNQEEAANASLEGHDEGKDDHLVEQKIQERVDEIQDKIADVQEDIAHEQGNHVVVADSLHDAVEQKSEEFVNQLMNEREEVGGVSEEVHDSAGDAVSDISGDDAVQHKAHDEVDNKNDGNFYKVVFDTLKRNLSALQDHGNNAYHVFLEFIKNNKHNKELVVSVFSAAVIFVIIAVAYKFIKKGNKIEGEIDEKRLKAIGDNLGVNLDEVLPELDGVFKELVGDVNELDNKQDEKGQQANEKDENDYLGGEQKGFVAENNQHGEGDQFHNNEPAEQEDVKSFEEQKERLSEEIVQTKEAILATYNEFKPIIKGFDKEDEIDLGNKFKIIFENYYEDFLNLGKDINNINDVNKLKDLSKEFKDKKNSFIGAARPVSEELMKIKERIHSNNNEREGIHMDEAVYI